MPNKNFSHNSNFLFGTTLFTDDVIYNVQNATIPGVGFNHIGVGRSSINGFVFGDTLEFNGLSVSIIIDEHLKTWRTILKTIFFMREQNQGTGINVSERAWLVLQDDNGHDIFKIIFHDAMIESIGDVEFNSTSEDDIQTLQINLVYDNYELEELDSYK